MKGSGLVEALTVAADTPEQLKHAVSIPLCWHRRVLGFKKHVVRGKPVLAFFWHVDAKHGITELIAPVTTAEELVSSIYAWLKTVDYGPEPEHDGDNHKGWRLTAIPPESVDALPYSGYNPYHIFSVAPEWVEYGK